MKLRRFLTNTTLIFSFAGLSCVCVLFVESLNVNAKALANRPHYRIDDIRVGDYKFINAGPRGYWETVFLFYRATENNISVWTLPRVQGKFLMPDLDWRRLGYLCENFGVDKDKKVFRCFDDSIRGWESAQREWQWDLSGKNLGRYTEDMINISGDVTRKYFIHGATSK